METWIGLGYPVDELFIQTYRTFNIHIRAKEKVFKREYEEKLTLAYMQAAWSQMGSKMPKLEKILGRKEKPREVSPEEFWNIFNSRIQEKDPA